MKVELPETHEEMFNNIRTIKPSVIDDGKFLVQAIEEFTKTGDYDRKMVIDYNQACILGLFLSLGLRMYRQYEEIKENE